MIDKANIRRNLSRLMAAKSISGTSDEIHSICFTSLIISRRTVKTYSPFP